MTPRRGQLATAGLETVKWVPATIRLQCCRGPSFVAALLFNFGRALGKLEAADRAMKDKPSLD